MLESELPLGWFTTDFHEEVGFPKYHVLLSSDARATNGYFRLDLHPPQAMLDILSFLFVSEFISPLLQVLIKLSVGNRILTIHVRYYRNTARIFLS